MMNRLTKLSILAIVLLIAASSNAVSLIRTSGNLSDKSFTFDNSVSLDGTTLNLTGDISGSLELQFQLVPTQSTGWIWINRIEGESDYIQLSSSTSLLESGVGSDSPLFPSAGEALPTITRYNDGTHTSQNGSVVAVPEPGTFLVFGLGLVLLGLVISRKFKTQSAS